MPSKKHLHRYRRRTTVTLKGKQWDRWFCILPNCNHWVQSREDLLGKQALCFYCSEPFVIALTTLDKAKLGCGECRKLVDGKIVNLPKTNLSVQAMNNQDLTDDEGEGSGITIGGLSLEEILEGKK